MHRLSARRWAAVFATAIVLCLLWATRLDDTPIDKDAEQNALMALNLDRHGVISVRGTPPYEPTMEREPMPAWTGLLAVRAIDLRMGRADSNAYFQGERARLLKLQNVPWLILLSWTVFTVCRRLGLPFWMALLGVLLSNMLLFNSEYGTYMLNSLYTESAAAALLTLGSLLLARGVSRQSWLPIVGAGVAFGVLALFKAAFLYVTVVVMLVIPTLALLRRQSLRVPILQSLLLGTLMAVIVVPWMLRDYREIGYFGIAGRGGEVSHNRAIMDLMTPDELVGSIYIWAPYPIGGVLRRVLGYSKADSEAGGRLQRFNDTPTSSFAARDEVAERAGRPADAISFYRKGRAEMFALMHQFAAAGNPQPYMAADQELKKRTFNIVIHHPFRHAALTLISLWRGAYFSFLPLAIAFVYSIRRYDQEMALLVLPGLVLVLFYAVGTYFEPRYSMPTYPMVVCLLIVAIRHQVLRYRSRSA